ncbi:MAG: type III-B CRISPR module RAMP protein Cmr6 [Candidatus Micrarchaeota archaeon]|nr:type III-B CRISPR module RAMP protein Cmr6 [Candidatus Micrarchaeota archaeon]
MLHPLVSIPQQTINAFQNNCVISENINLLLNRYLLFSDAIEDIKKEIFFYIVKDEQYFESIVKEYFSDITKEKKKADENKKNKLEQAIKKANKILKRTIVINKDDNFREKERHVLNTIGNVRRKIFNSIESTLRNVNLKLQQLSPTKITLATSSRLIVGLGSTSVLETSIKLHHIYGVPYIPSSALKGILRAYKMWKLANWNIELLRAFEIAIREIYEKCKDPKVEFNKRLQEIDSLNIKAKDDKEHLHKFKDKINEKSNHLLEILSIFGTQNQRGSLIVFDAYPDKFSGFDIDIMNPHYPEYYQGSEPPADWQNPNPIIFLTVPENTQFNFYFLNPYEQLYTDLQGALETLGIGSKTALGYGTFR